MDKKQEVIAVTADTHFFENESDSLYNNFEKILEELAGLSVSKLVIAGDVFNKEFSNYNNFSNIVSKYDIDVYLIPGNHDSNISQKYFTEKNITVVSETSFFYLDSEKKNPFLFVPYKKNTTIGEEISFFADQLKKQQWILIGHGDYFAGFRSVNNYEKGIYMPLTRYDVEKFEPVVTFLGHIHKPSDIESVYYPGSPFPLDSSECGLRRVLLFNLNTLSVTSHTLITDTIYFNESVYVYPFTNESMNIALEEQLKEMIAGWDLKSEFLNKVSLKIAIKGCVDSSKKRAEEVVAAYLKGFVKEVVIDSSELIVVDTDIIRQELLKDIEIIAKNIVKENTDMQNNILLSALKSIYD